MADRTSILQPVMRLVHLFYALWLPISLLGQTMEPGRGTALSFARSVNAPLNAVQLHDAAVDAWNWTFGKEPGARVLLADRTAGVLKGTARMNFRSAMLNGREETMGTVTYAITIQVQPGECRLTIADLNHSGNRNTARGGIHLKQLMRTDEDAYHTSGMSRSNVVRLHQELRTAATDHINALMKAFEARLRARTGP